MSTENDPMVMYLVVRESLNMSAGKTAAQCAHAAQMLQMNYSHLYFESLHLEEYENSYFGRTLKEDEEFEKLQREMNQYEDWLGENYRKVILRADEKEWLKLKNSLENNDVLVIDAGLTEIEPNTETVIGLWPMRKSKVGKLIKRLQVLK